MVTRISDTYLSSIGWIIPGPDTLRRTCSHSCPKKSYQIIYHWHDNCNVATNQHAFTFQIFACVETLQNTDYYKSKDFDIPGFKYKVTCFSSDDE